MSLDFIPFIIYVDHVTGRIYTYSIYPLPFPNKQVLNQFTINYNEERVIDSVIQNTYCKICPRITYSDFEAFHTGDIYNIINQLDMCVYYSNWNREFLSVVNKEINFGFYLN